MTLSKSILTFFFGLLLTTTVFAQSPGVTWSSNVTLLCKTDYGRGPEKGRDVWGWKDNQSGKHYALVILNKGLSIVDASTPSAPVEVVHINNNDTTTNLSAVDVETFESGGQTYAYLSRSSNSVTYFVLVINLNQAINQSGFYGIDPENGSLGTVFVGRIQNPYYWPNYSSDIAWQAHTLTITDGYLYVATLKDKIPV